MHVHIIGRHRRGRKHIGTDGRDGEEIKKSTGYRRERERGEKKSQRWSRSQVSEHDVRSCLATVVRSSYRQGALFYFMYS